VIISSDAFGTTQSCTGSISGQTINANITVPSGVTCSGVGTTINGNVVVQPGGRLSISGNSFIYGNLSSSSAGTDPLGFSITFCDSTVSGTIGIVGSASPVRVGALCGGNAVGSNVNISNNLAEVSLSGNTITGNAYVNDNTGPTAVQNNKVSGILSCSGNGGFFSAGNSFKHGYGQCA